MSKEKANEQIKTAKSFIEHSDSFVLKADVLTLLTKAQAELSKQPEPNEFTKECRELIKTDDDNKGGMRLSGYVIWLEVKLGRACSIIDHQTEELKEKDAEIERHRQIPINERLPDEGVCVLVLMESGYIGKCEIIDGEWQCLGDDIVTHWWPIILP